MSIIDIILVVLCVAVSGICVYTDIKMHKVKNIIVFPMMIVGFVLNTISSIKSDGLRFFCINLVAIFIFSIIMYLLEFWSAGDSKLLLCLFFLVPYNLYYGALTGSFGSIAVVMFVFIVAFAYLLIETGVLFLKRAKTLKQKKQRPLIIIKHLLLALIRSASIITIINIVYYYTIPNLYQNNQYIFMLVNFFVVYIINKTKVLNNRIITIGLFLVTASFVILSDYYRRFIGSDFKMILIFASIIVIRRIIGTYNYKLIPIGNIKSGMILSTISSVKLSKKKIADSLSDESLKCKLTEEECLGIKEKAVKQGYAEPIFIIRTIPFATLISLGVIMFNIVRIICIYWNT